MKKSRLFFAIAVSVFAFASCQKEQASVNNGGEKTVRFVAESIETKTAFGAKDGESYPTLWTENDSKVKISMNYGAPKDATITPSADYKSASFEAEIVDDESSEYTFYSLSPSTACLGISDQNKSITIQVPNSQTPTASSVDETAQILVAKSDKYSNWPSEVALNYSHVTAYGKMSFANLNLNGATVSSVSLTAKGEDGSDIGWVGRWYYYPDTKTFGNNSVSATITINTASTTDIWFACTPVDLSGKQIEVTVNTTAGPLTRSITWPANKPFISGKVFKFAVDMEGITPGGTKTYTKVTDKSELTVDSELIIVASSADFAMSTTQNSNNRGAVSVTKSGNTIDNPGPNVQVFKARAGMKSNTIAFYDYDNDGGYIYAASSSSNHLKTQSEINENSSFSINFSEGVATLVAQGSYTRNTLQYNSSSSLFACYSSASQSGVCIYKLNGSGTSTPIFGPVPKHILTISECEGGSISVSAGGQSILTGAEVEEGTELTLTATPEGDLVFDAWNVTGADNTQITVIDNKFTMPASDVTVSATFEKAESGQGDDKVLSFDLTKNPGDWPTTNSTTLTNYTYTLNGTGYSFGLKNVKSNSGYLMLTQPAALGLPAIEGYKLTKVVASNSASCSTSVNVGVSSSDSSANYIDGGAAQKWATTSSSYTYNLAGTASNTVYYLYVTSKNAQITNLELTYSPVN